MNHFFDVHNVNTRGDWQVQSSQKGLSTPNAIMDAEETNCITSSGQQNLYSRVNSKFALSNRGDKIIKVSFEHSDEILKEYRVRNHMRRTLRFLFTLLWEIYGNLELSALPTRNDAGLDTVSWS